MSNFACLAKSFCRNTAWRNLSNNIVCMAPTDITWCINNKHGRNSIYMYTYIRLHGLIAQLLVWYTFCNMTGCYFLAIMNNVTCVAIAKHLNELTSVLLSQLGARKSSKTQFYSWTCYPSTFIPIEWQKFQHYSNIIHTLRNAFRWITLLLGQ